MFAVLRHCGIPEAVVKLCYLCALENSKSAVMVDGNLSDSFDVTIGVLQGDVLAPFLFVVLVDYKPRRNSGVVIHPRRSIRHPAKSLNDLDFADDITLLESSITQAQAQFSRTAEAAADLGPVSDFRYLGSMVASGSSDLKRRKSLAWCAFWKLEQLWKSPHIPIATKVRLCHYTTLWLSIMGDLPGHGKQNQRLCYLMLQSHAEYQTH